MTPGDHARLAIGRREGRAAAGGEDSHGGGERAEEVLQSSRQIVGGGGGLNPGDGFDGELLPIRRGGRIRRMEVANIAEQPGEGGQVVEGGCRKEPGDGHQGGQAAEHQGYNNRWTRR